MKHVNAKQVLPPDLLREVQRHCHGYVYVPGRDGFYERRRTEVIRLSRQGIPTDEIARRAHLCRRRVQQILRTDCHKKKIGDSS